MIPGMFGRLASRYVSLLERRPIVTKSVTGTLPNLSLRTHMPQAYFVISAGDLTAQSITQRKMRTDDSDVTPTLDYKQFAFHFSLTRASTYRTN